MMLVSLRPGMRLVHEARASVRAKSKMANFFIIRFIMWCKGKNFFVTLRSEIKLFFDKWRNSKEP